MATLRTCCFCALFQCMAVFVSGQQYSFQTTPWHEFQWSGDTGQFIPTEAGIRLDAPAIASSTLISIENEVTLNAYWEVHATMEFNPSSNNYLEIMLGGHFDEDGTGFNGFIIRAGGSKDNVTLYRTSAGVSEMLIEGTSDRLDHSTVELIVLVSNDSLGHWKLYSGVNGDSLQFEGESQHSIPEPSRHFGLSFNYTSSRSKKFVLHEVEIAGEPFYDFQPPRIQQLVVINDRTVCLSFDESVLVIDSLLSVHLLDSENLFDHYFSPGPQSSQICLAFQKPFPVLMEQQLFISGFADSSQNLAGDIIIGFQYVQLIEPSIGDVVIHELMIDPTPPEDLPVVEFIELYNTRDEPVLLRNMIVQDLRTSAHIDSAVILPKSYLILAPSEQAHELTNYGLVLGLHPWPSLNNGEDAIFLMTTDLTTIDSMAYDLSQFSDSKSEGGWSLEQRNPYHPCSDITNWSFSIDPSGGTPGKVNSIFSSLPNPTPLGVSEITMINDNTLTVCLTKSISPDQVNQADFLLNQMMLLPKQTQGITNLLTLEAGHPIPEGPYVLLIEGLADCFGIPLIDNQVQLLVDRTPPALQSISFPDFGVFHLEWDEDLDIAELDYQSFRLQNIGTPKSLSWDSGNRKLILKYDTIFTQVQTLEFNISDVLDLAGNTAPDTTVSVEYRPPPIASIYDLIITEIMAAPNESGGFPVEYVEIYNASQISLPLTGVTLSDKSTTSRISSPPIPPGAYHVLYPAGVHTFEEPRSTALNPWPSLNNSGDQLILTNQLGEAIHSLSYDTQWYHDPYKEDGGWSLEMVDTNYPCRQLANWRASQSETGGTPGAENSVSSSNPDLTGPDLVAAWIEHTGEIRIEWNEVIDTLSLRTEGISLTPTNHIQSFEVLTARTMVLYPTTPLHQNVQYNLSIDGVKDCSGNTISGGSTSTNIVLPVPLSQQSGVIINEVLANPRPFGKDFVELYNHSHNYLNLNDAVLTNGIDTVAITSDFIMAPGDYVVLTSSRENILQEYPGTPVESLLQTPLPAFPDEKGSVVIRDNAFSRVDSMTYSEALFHPIYHSSDGVSLERISFEGDSWDQGLWKSASSLSNFATPGRANSVQIGPQSFSEVLQISPKVFNPHRPGTGSFTTLAYSFTAPGYVGVIEVYSTYGRLVQRLASNAQFGQNGIITWDGTDLSGSIVDVGPYLIQAWFAGPDDHQFTIKETVIVATEF